MISQDLQQSQIPQGRDGLSLLSTWRNLGLALDHGLVSQAQVLTWCASLSEVEAGRLLEAIQEHAQRHYGDWLRAA